MATGRNRFGHRTPVMDGYEMVKRIRETDPDTPILSVRDVFQRKDVVKGYELGVNNYLKKPFLPEELNAHVQALMKMKQKHPPQHRPRKHRSWRKVSNRKNYTLDAEQHATLKHASGTNKTPTARETKLLQMLCEKKGEVVKRETILEKSLGNGGRLLRFTQLWMYLSPN